MAKDLFGMVVIVSVNIINHDAGKYLVYNSCKCRKNLVDKVVERGSTE